MKKLSDKNKKYFIIAGLGAVCIALVFAISSQFKTTVAADATVTSSSALSGSITASLTVSSETEGKAVSAQPKEQSSSALSSSSTVPTNQPVQNLQSKVSKPKQPTESEVKNPSKKPGGTNSTASKAEQGGETKNGQVYLPGFGWVPDTGGSGTTVGNEGDELTGNKVGSMG